MNAEGKQEHCTKRLLLCNLKELYEQFKILNPGVKVGFSTCAMLRPRECVQWHSFSLCVHCTKMQSSSFMVAR